MSAWEVTVVEDTIEATVEVVEVEVVHLDEGPPGRPGTGAVVDPFVFIQPTPATSWVLEHNLGRSPVSVRVVDELGNEVLVSTFDQDPSTTIVTVTPALAGTATVF